MNPNEPQDRSNALHPDMIVVNIGELCTVDAPGIDEHGPRRRGDLSELGLVGQAAMAIADGRILSVGPAQRLIEETFSGQGIPSEVTVVDAGGRCVVPGFVDPHTHAVFGRTRQDEYERRIKGESYLEIAAAGGGIHASVADTRTRAEADLQSLTAKRLREMRRWGTTTVEIKSGYGLTLDEEIKMLRAGKQAALEVGLRAVLTCLAAHEIPPEYADNRQGYVRLIVDEILPLVAREGLATRCDVFCEPSVFTLEETVVILSRARDLGLHLTVHADELAGYGGAVLAARMGAQSADHLLRIDQTGREALQQSGTVAVLLPGTAFTLGMQDYAPARAMIDGGVAVALATDFNPGSCPILAMPLIMSMACTQMRMTPAESLVAATVNSAWALGLEKEVGSLAPGKCADFLILDGDDYRLMAYRAGHNPVLRVFQAGQEIGA